jgi:LysR family cyn operon transcriptional activator
VGRIGELSGCGAKVSVQDIARYPLALPAKGLQARDTLESILFTESVNLDIRLEINSVRVLLDLVANSPLVTTLSEEAIHHVKGFEAIPIDHPDGRMDGCYHYLKGTYLKMAAQQFLELLQDNNSFHQILSSHRR